jgi:murein DD-endopeptidase MepM/ murein hydrolase activator NlpD
MTFLALGIPANAANPVTGRISAGMSGLSVRNGATTLASRIGTWATGTTVTIQCQVVGQGIAGRVRSTNRWDVLSNGLYISDAYVTRPGGVALCPADGNGAVSGTQLPPTAAPSTPNAPSGTWVSPVAPYRTGQSFRTPGRPNHDGEDFVVPRNYPIRAASSGRVITVRCNASTNNCDVDGSTKVTGCGWYVEILHAGDIVTRYCHMIRRPEVSVGQQVKTGQVIGYVGSSGNSSGAHLHFEVHAGRTANRANAIDPIAFMAKAGAKIT